MITPVKHVSRHPTTRPPERMRTVLVELGQVPVIAILKATCAPPSCAPSRFFFLAYPSDQFQLAFVFRAVLAFTVLLVPFPAEFLVSRPIFPLAFHAFKTARQYGSGDGIWAALATYCNTRFLCTLNICVISPQGWSGLCRRFCTGGDWSWSRRVRHRGM